jgi:hypothetical protein
MADRYVAAARAHVVSAPSASPQEAAAIVAAIERFMRATAPPPTSTAQEQELDGWQGAAILEGVSRDPWAEAPDPWINT